MTSSEMDVLQQLNSILKASFAKENQGECWVWGSEDKRKETEEMREGETESWVTV